MEYEDDDHADRAAQLALPSVGRPRSSRGRRLSWLKHSFSSLVSVRPSSRPSTTPTQLRTNTNIILTTTNNNNNNDASVKLENHSVRTQTNQINNDDDHYRRRRRRKRRRKLLLQLEQEEAKIIKPQLPVMHTPSASPKILVALALLAWCPSLIIAIGPHMLFSEDSSVRLGGDDELMMKFTSDQLATSLVPYEKPQDNQNLSKRDNNSSNNNNSTSTTEETPMSQGAASQSTWSMLMAALFEYQAVGERTGSFGDIYDDRQAGTSTEVNDNDKYNESSSYTVNWPNLILALVLILLMLTTAIGNLFVIVAILIERNLRTLGNYLVLSLAIADLLVALLVMPLASIYLILDSWTLGVRLCDIWTSADVFCCTASILHLLAIALDRYWAVTRVDYIRCQRNDRRILSMIFCVWMAAGVISLAPAFGWKDAEYEERILNNKECLISQDIGYQIFATCTTFYFPLTLTLIFYWKIYQVARKRIRRKLDNRAKLKPPHPSSTSSGSIVPTTGGHGGGGNKTKQIAKNQSIVKYSQRPGAAAKFTTSSTGPVLQGTISGSRSIAVTNRPASSACDCLCHKSNQAQSDGTTSAATATKSDGAKQATTATTTEPIAVRPQPSEMEPRRADMDGAKAAGANSNCQAAGGLQKQPTASLLQADEKVLGGDCGKPDGEEAQAAQDSKRNNRNNNALGNEGAEEANKKAQTNGQIVDFNDDDNQDDEGAGGRPGKTATAETVIADECGAIADEDDAVKQQATTVPVCTNGENLSHGRKRRQSNLNSSCSRCRRNQFQDESQSESLASCSRASSLQANDEYGLEEEEEENQDDEGGALGANSRNYSSLSSNNCTHGLLLMDTNSLDGGTSDQMSSMPAAARRTARASVAALPSHRKSLGVVVGVGRRLSTNGCDCCTACTICCHPEQLMQIGDSELVGNADSKPMSDGINQQMAAAAAETTTTTTNRNTHPNTWQRTDSNSVSQSQELNLGHSLDNRRALEVTLDKEGRMTCGLIEPACQPVRECSIDMLGCPRLEDASGNINNNNNLDGMSKERRNCAAGLLSNNGSASWFTATRRKVKRRLAPLEPTRNIMAICWRHLVMATLAQFRVGHSNQQQQQQQQQAFESAGDVMATDQHSTSVLIVGNQHHCVVGQPTVTSTTMNYQASSQFDDEDYVASGNLNRIAVVVCQVCQCPQLALGTTTNTTANMTTNTVAPVSATGKFDADERDKLESSGNQDERGEEDTTTSSSMQQRQVADSVCRADTDSANLVAVVACTTTNIALTTAEGPNQKSGDSASIAAAAYPNHGRPLLEHCSPSQKPRLFLLQQQHSMQSSPTIQSHAAQMEGVESKRERKAAKTLAIITGVFVMCWLPFFMMAIAMPLLQLKPHKYLFAFLLWLGYFNSMLNPIIYTIFSPDFRKAFKRLLCGSDEDGQRKKRQRAACGGTSSSCIQSNGNRNGNGMSSRCRTGGGDRSNDGYLTAIGDRLRDISPALSRWLSCTGGDTGNGNCHNNSHEKKGHCGGNQLGGTMPLDTNININMLTGTNEGRFTPNTAMITPNSSPTIIPGKQQSPASNYMSSPNRPKSIITNHF